MLSHVAIDKDLCSTDWTQIRSKKNHVFLYSIEILLKFIWKFLKIKFTVKRIFNKIIFYEKINDIKQQP